MGHMGSSSLWNTCDEADEDSPTWLISGAHGEVTEAREGLSESDNMTVVPGDRNIGIRH